MPEVYTELTQPTAVSSALALPFTSASSQNLVVAKTSLLQIFNVVYHDSDLDPDQAGEDGEDGTQFDRRISSTNEEDQPFVTADVSIQRMAAKVSKLVLVAEYALSGTITSLARVRVLSSKSGGECLLVGTKDAKLSLVEWDPSTNGVSTISIHYYERDEFKSPVMPDSCINYLTADPQSRCVALKFNQDMLAILPFRQKEDEYVLDDIDEDMYDADSGEKTTSSGKKAANGTTAEKSIEKPYYPSFVVSATQLDEDILHIISIAFLYEYREPTFGILYQPKRTALGLLDSGRERKDNVNYIIITVDLEQRASTNIIQVNELPFDCYRVVPMPTPIGGSLLLGANQLIHVDQAGKTIGIAVNVYARQTTNFMLADQSDLELELEDCVVGILDEDEGDVLIITKRGEGLLLRFKMDGRSVSGLSLTRFGEDNLKGPFCGGRPSCLIPIAKRGFFVGSLEGDSKLLGWRRKGERANVDAKKEETAFDEDDDQYAFDDLDDLYGAGQTASAAKTSSAKSKGDYVFQIHDRLINLGPFTDLTFGRPVFPEEQAKKQKGSVAELEVVCTSGNGGAADSGISIMRSRLTPQVIGRFDFPQCEALWTIRTRKVPKRGTTETDDEAMADEYDRYLITSKAEDSLIFKVGGVFQEVTGTEFDTAGATVDAGVLREGRRIIQCCESVVRCYDSDLNVTQMIPMYDDDTGAEPTILSANFCDPYLLLIRDDGSALVYHCDEQSLELEPIAGSEIEKKFKYVSGSLYAAKQGTLLAPKVQEGTATDFVCFLLSDNGTLEIYDLLSWSKPFFTTSSLPYLPRFLASSEKAPPDRPSLKRKLVELLVADLGDNIHKEPYLILRTNRNDLVLYHPYIFYKNQVANLRFVKTTNHRIPIPTAQSSFENQRRQNRPMRILPDVRGFSAVFMPGDSPSFIIKSSKSIPRVHPLTGSPVRSMSSFHTSAADKAFTYVDSTGAVRVCQLPDFNFDNTWSAKKIYLQRRTHGVAFYPPMSVYAVLTSQKVPFENLQEGEVAPQPPVLLPKAETGQVQLFSALTWGVIDTYELAQYEVPLVVKCVDMEVSEQTKQRKQLLAVGTGIFRGEDIAARGCIYVFEVVEVVPEPGKPETNRRLKLVVKEEVKGTVSALCAVNGFLLAAQGQKVMVRGLKEDDSLLPVGFMDMNMYVSVAKSLDSMLLFGDFMKGISFVGFSEEPYKMTQFGKDIDNIEVMAAEFLPEENQLFFVVVDGDCNIHILQYDPEHPKSLVGQRLIHKAEFFAGHEIRSLTLLPRTHLSYLEKHGRNSDVMDTTSDSSDHVVLAATMTGALAMITTVPEAAYRRLNIVQSQIINGEEHTAGLNPRAYRSSTYRSPSTELLRGVLDGAFLGRYLGLSEVRKAEIAGKARSSEEIIREDLMELETALLYI